MSIEQINSLSKALNQLKAFIDESEVTIDPRVLLAVQECVAPIEAAIQRGSIKQSVQQMRSKIKRIDLAIICFLGDLDLKLWRSLTPVNNLESEKIKPPWIMSSNKPLLPQVPAHLKTSEVRQSPSDFVQVNDPVTALASLELGFASIQIEAICKYYFCVDCDSNHQRGGQLHPHQGLLLGTLGILIPLMRLIRAYRSPTIDMIDRDELPTKYKTNRKKVLSGSYAVSQLLALRHHLCQLCWRKTMSFDETTKTKHKLIGRLDNSFRHDCLALDNEKLIQAHYYSGLGISKTHCDTHNTQGSEDSLWQFKIDNKRQVYLNAIFQLMEDVCDLMDASELMVTYYRREAYSLATLKTEKLKQYSKFKSLKEIPRFYEQPTFSRLDKEDFKNQALALYKDMIFEAVGFGYVPTPFPYEVISSQNEAILKIAQVNLTDASWLEPRSYLHEFVNEANTKLKERENLE